MDEQMKRSCVEAAASPLKRTFPNLSLISGNTSGPLLPGFHQPGNTEEQSSGSSRRTSLLPSAEPREAMPATLPLGLCVLMCPPIHLLLGDTKSVCNSRSVTAKREAAQAV